MGDSEGQEILACCSPWDGKESDTTEWLNNKNHLGFPNVSDGKGSTYNSGDPDSIPGLGRSTGEGNGNPLQYSCLGNPMTEGPGRLQSMGSLRVGHD